MALHRPAPGVVGERCAERGEVRVQLRQRPRVRGSNSWAPPSATHIKRIGQVVVAPDPALAPVKRRQLLPKPTTPPLHAGGFAHAHFTRTSGGMSVSIVNTKRYTPSMNVAIAGEGRPL